MFYLQFHASLLSGEGFKGALADAVKVKSDAPKIKQAAAMLGIKGEQAQKLYETKLKNTKRYRLLKK